MTSDSVLLTQHRSKLGTQVIHLFPPHYSQSIFISKWPVRIIYSPMGFHVTVPLRIYGEPKGNVYALVLMWNPRFLVGSLECHIFCSWNKCDHFPTSLRGQVTGESVILYGWIS